LVIGQCHLKVHLFNLGLVDSMGVMDAKQAIWNGLTYVFFVPAWHWQYQDSGTWTIISQD